jgi:MFS family permease
VISPAAPEQAESAQPASIRRRLPGRGHPQAVLATILVAQLMVLLDLTIVNVALPQMQQSLDFTHESLSWVLNAYSLAFGGLLLLGARAGDLLGRRRTFIAGIILFAAASFVGGVATTSGMLLAARTAQGIGGALIAPATLALLTSMFPEGRERNRALGLYTAVSIGGAAVGLIAGGILTEWASWRWVMFVNVPIGVAVFAATLRFVPETPRQVGRFDLAGAATSTLGVTSIVYGFVRAAEHGWSDVLTVGGFLVGAALLASFVAV